MNINNQIRFISWQQLCTQLSQDETAKPVHMNPQGSRNGEEYFWEHLDQLQETALHFEEHIPAAEYEKEGISGLKEAKQISSPERALYPEAFEPIPVLDIKTKELIQTQAYIEQAIFVSMYPKRADSKSLYLIPTEEKKPVYIEPVTDQDVPIAPNTLPIPKFNGHQLYIENQHAEISVRNESHSLKDEKELVEAIKVVLKRQNLGIKQIRINGVLYD